MPQQPTPFDKNGEPVVLSGERLGSLTAQERQRLTTQLANLGIETTLLSQFKEAREAAEGITEKTTAGIDDFRHMTIALGGNRALGTKIFTALLQAKIDAGLPGEQQDGRLMTHSTKAAADLLEIDYPAGTIMIPVHQAERKALLNATEINMSSVVDSYRALEEINPSQPTAQLRELGPAGGEMLGNIVYIAELALLESDA